MNATSLPNRPVIHLKEFAAAAGVSPNTIVRGMKVGQIPRANKVGRRLTWPRDVVAVFLGLSPKA